MTETGRQRSLPIGFLRGPTCYSLAMDYTICDISAFRYHRTPPQVIMLCPPLPPLEPGRRRQDLRSHPLVSEVLGTPLHTLARSKSSRPRSATLQPHLLTGDIPFGAVQATPLGVDATSPLMTLFHMARRIPETHLVMALYEFCGWFTVFKPTPRIEALLREADRSSLVDSSFGWRRTRNAADAPSGLWQRPPLIDLDELVDFANDMSGRRGGPAFLRAARQVTGITASPFEAQASMLLSLPRSRGGEELTGLVNNQRIALSREATRLSGKTACYADILLEGNASAPLIIECQGKSAHASAAAVMSDSDRTTALQHMGYDVILLTYSQIAQQSQFRIVKKLIASKLGISLRGKTPRLEKAENELRRDLFIDWNVLGSYDKR